VPQDYEIYRTLIYYLSEKKRWGEVRRASWLRQLALPDRPEAYVDFIVACAEEGDDAKRAEAEQAYFERFGADTQALLRLGEYASRTGRVAVTGRIADRCRELGRNEPDAILLDLGAHLERRAYQEVVNRCIAVGAEGLKWPERQRLTLGALQAVALYGLGQGAEALPLVRRLYETRVVPSQVLTVVAVQLQKVGQDREARRVLRHAVEVDPLNQAGLVLLLRSILTERELDEAPVLVDRLLGMRQPPVDLLNDMAHTLDSDLYLFLPERERTLAKIKDFLRDRVARMGAP
jgi:hypothetical protein